jgi:hypothetical protein
MAELGTPWMVQLQETGLWPAQIKQRQTMAYLQRAYKTWPGQVAAARAGNFSTPNHCFTFEKVAVLLADLSPPKYTRMILKTTPFWVAMGDEPDYEYLKLVFSRFARELDEGNMGPFMEVVGALRDMLTALEEMPKSVGGDVTIAAGKQYEKWLGITMDKGTKGVMEEMFTKWP